MRWISRHFLWFVGLSLAIPFVAGFILHGFSLTAALWTLLWAGFVRIFFIHHVTWSINSVCHYFGRRRFDIEDKSTNVAWLAIPTFGESWHHNHHAFPRSARQGLGKFEVDISAMLIWAHGEGRHREERRADHARAPAGQARRREEDRGRRSGRLSRDAARAPASSVGAWTSNPTAAVSSSS